MRLIGPCWTRPDSEPRVYSDVSAARLKAGLTRFLRKSFGSSVQPREEKRPASRHTRPPPSGNMAKAMRKAMKAMRKGHKKAAKGIHTEVRRPHLGPEN